MASQERSEDKLNNILEIYNNSQDYNSSYTYGSLWVDTLRKPLIAHINLIKSSRKEIRGVQYCPDGLVNTSPKRPKRAVFLSVRERKCIGYERSESRLGSSLFVGD